jgi:hypothetical protein
MREGSGSATCAVRQRGEPGAKGPDTANLLTFPRSLCCVGAALPLFGVSLCALRSGDNERRAGAAAAGTSAPPSDCFSSAGDGRASTSLEDMMRVCGRSVAMGARGIRENTDVAVRSESATHARCGGGCGCGWDCSEATRRCACLCIARSTPAYPSCPLLLAPRSAALLCCGPAAKDSSRTKGKQRCFSMKNKQAEESTPAKRIYIQHQIMCG